MKNIINQSEAENKLFAYVNEDMLGDKIYEFVKSLYHEGIDAVNEHHIVKDNNGDDYASDEEWYDDCYEEFFEYTYENIVNYLSNKD